MKKIFYVSGTRADYGLMRNILLKLHHDPETSFAVCATGMHLSSLYGLTINEIEADGVAIAAKIPVDIESSSPSTMAQSIGYEILGFVEVFEREKPDLIILLGDRGEMLAAAIAASHLNIHIAHVHGGERSGTVDEMVRHAVSKFSHFHFVATQEARNRLIRMGELPNHIFAVGAPGLDEMMSHHPMDRSEFLKRLNFEPNKPLALIVFHPVVQDYETINVQLENLLKTALKFNFQMICAKPNSDAGGNLLRQVWDDYKDHQTMRIITHMPRKEYIDCLANVDIMLGNSSSGIIEAASYNLPVVNIGNRQNLRERSDNIIDTDVSEQAIEEGIKKALAMKGKKFTNVYGDGKTTDRFINLVKALPLEQEILNKYNAY